MNDFSDVILLIGAMVAFSMLSMTTARTFQSDSNLIINSELEHRAISTGQAIIDEMRWLTNENEFKPANNIYYFKDYPKDVTMTYGKNNEYSSTYAVNGSSTLVSSTGGLNRYLIKVNVRNTNAPNSSAINLEFIKSFKQ